MHGQIAIGAIALFAALGAQRAAEAAEAWPAKPVRIVVASTAGSTPDVLARILGENLSPMLKQPVIVDNKPGAGGIVGIDSVAKAAPDGYTLTIGHDGTMAINTVIYKKLPYDPARDFTPIAELALNEFVLIAHPSTGVKTFADFVAFVKKANGDATYASAGPGTPNHVFMEQLAKALGVTMRHVPYKGGAAAVTDVAGGQVQFMLAGIAPALPQIRGERVTPVAVVQGKRAAILPNVPTVGESVPGFSLKTWFGLFAPAKMSPEIVARLNRDVLEILSRPDVKDRLSAQGMMIETGTPAALGALVQSDIKRYQQLAKEIKLEAN
ncbi:MAG: tripartite tricarboxylate transporter substrate binding protein [Burkholderiales bacterium]|nr:tripartite tricarboxylate transporter substrate binding protein [Burkholderiales bacterium]